MKAKQPSFPWVTGSASLGGKAAEACSSLLPASLVLRQNAYGYIFPSFGH